MPRETIRRLSRDVERVLVAGAHLAAGDADLAKDRAALDGLAVQLGTKAPVIGQLAAAAAKAVAAPPTSAAVELVSLATMAAQVRNAQAQPAVPAATTALPVRVAIGTPCNAKDLGELYTALVQSGSGRMEKIDQGIERGDIADLRLVDAVIHAMGDSYIGEKVTTAVVPLLGAAVVAPIRASLDLTKGRSIDGRRLRALVAIEGEGAHDLLTEALGSAAIREAALDAIADHVRGDPAFEPLVLAIIRTEKRNAGVGRAAVRALAGYASDESLQALIAALDHPHTMRAAAEALGRSRHPHAVTWLLERLATAVAQVRTDRAAAKVAAKAKESDPAAAKAAGAALHASEGFVAILLEALTRQRDPRIAAAALPLIDEHGAAAASAVVANGDALQLAAVADRLAGDDREVFTVAAAAAAALGGDESHRRFSAAFAAKDREKPCGQARLAAVGRQLVESTDRRWNDACLAWLREPIAIAKHVLPLLGERRERRAVPELLGLLAKEKQPQILRDIIRTLGRIGDPAAIDPILALLDSKDGEVRWAIREAIPAMNDASAVAKVRAIYAGLKNPDHHDSWAVRSLLHLLEQTFPGH